ncbi:MAG TPA: hypothetical protein VKR06_15025 [Ktedonosporobacter sp.]|nr:hypothetical protein [Ktedonosporobacter sp.]
MACQSEHSASGWLSHYVFVFARLPYTGNWLLGHRTSERGPAPNALIRNLSDRAERFKYGAARF